MNKQFVAKMIQAKQLEYEALKEIMPEAMVNKIGKIENELLDFAKECFMSMMSATKEEHQTAEEDNKSKVRKVTIE